uniref:separase n=1 Tax=Echeneis naucrates TaxID=173247 RepID=A0A665W0V1_ECHNA
ILSSPDNNYVNSRPGLQGRTLCDRVIRACNHQLGVGTLDFDHVTHLVKLVELSLHGYDTSAALVPQSSPLYMEKIIFHIVKKLSSLEAHNLGILIKLHVSQAEDYYLLLRSCFSVLWTGLSAAKDRKTLNPQDKLHCKLLALSFLLLLDTGSETSSFSKAPIYTEDAIAEFEHNSGVVTNEDASFLLQEARSLFNWHQTSGQGCEGNGSKECIDKSSVYTLSEMLLIIIQALCKAGYYDLASTLLNEIERKLRDTADCQTTALLLGKWAVKVHSKMKAGEECAPALRECARALRSLPEDLGDREAHAILEGCKLVVWAVESCNNKGLSGPVLLSWFSFLEEHQQLILKILNKVSIVAVRKNWYVCIYSLLMFLFFFFFFLSYYDGYYFIFVHVVIAVSNLACGLYNQRLYDQAFTLVEIICKDLCKNCPTSLSVDRLSKPFMLAVQTSRRAGQLERALDWVILWLKALGKNISIYMSEPVSLWVKTKLDAARNSEEDIRLRTLRDGFGPNVPDEQVMLCLLEEELHAYKEVAGDTAQERYNTLCDLLDICHEESSHTHLRAVYLCEMAQVVCFQDFSEQTDCSAVDFTHEALRLLEEEPETAANADKLKDDKAHALLWLYICTLERNLQEAIEKDKKLCEQTQCMPNPIGTNDFDFEDKQKTQDSILVYEGLHFNLAAENSKNQLLGALDEWSALLQSQGLPSIRNPKQTCSAIALTVQLEQAEKTLASDTGVDGPSSLSMFVILLKAQYCYSTTQVGNMVSSIFFHTFCVCFLLEQADLFNFFVFSFIITNFLPLASLSIFQVDRGVTYLCEVLKEVNEQRQSKTWYLLHAQVLQTCSSYLSLDTDALPQYESVLCVLGINSPDAALHQSLKLLCSLLVTLVGKGLYGTNGSTSDVRFIDQGDNLVLKWKILSELFNCSLKMVNTRSNCGAINDARLQCLETLKLAIKLQALSRCAELLVMKAELELMQGEREESKIDLGKVRNLLELCTGQLNVKIKPRKGRPVQKSQAPLPILEDDIKGILSTRWIATEPVVKDLACSPPLKAKPLSWLSSLGHESDCQCACCSEPYLGRATARWAATQADLVRQLDPKEAKVSLKLQWATLARCKSVTAKLGAKLNKLFPSFDHTRGSSKPSLMQDLVGRVYLCMALSGLEPVLNKEYGVWKLLEAGLAFVDSTPSPVLRPVRAGLIATKAIISLITLASKQGCNPEELFSKAWTWNEPKSKDTINNSDIPDKTKAAKKVKSLNSFDFDTVVPTLTFTPVQKVKAPASVQKAKKTAPKLQFHVYEELSPVQDKPQPVPAAPRRTKKLRFKVEFSDESDSEASTQAEHKEKSPPKKQPATRRAAHNAKAVLAPPAEKVLPKRQTRKKSTRASTRRGRTRKELSRAEAETMEEPDKMRTIEEETNEVLDISIEQLRTSDTEAEDPVSSKYLCASCVYGELSFNLLALSITEDIQASLRSACLALQHFPSPTIYPTLCTLLALSLGQKDPTTTAMLHAQSLGITSRHRTIRHLLSLTKSKISTEQKLAQLESIFSFPTADSSSFPQIHCQEFIQQLQHLPQGITVCLMSVLGVKPGKMGNSIILSRLEKGSVPVTVHIPTSNWLVQEMDSIQVEQKVVSCVSEKAKWWEGRRALDSRVEVSYETGHSSGCSSSILVFTVAEAGTAKEAVYLWFLFQAVLSAFPMLSQEDLQRFAMGLSPQWEKEFIQLFHTAASQLSERDKPCGHVVLILDRYLQKLPWESISVLKSHSVSRMPSLHSLIGLSYQKETDPHSILKQGVDAKKVFYVLDPDANLGNSQDRFKEWFGSKPEWEGVCGVAPDSSWLEEAVASKDLYIYVGHGAGARFLDSQLVLKQQMRAASLLFGCSSAALAVRGDQEGQGIILSYLIAGCPFVLGNLWDVTDRDIDRFTKALLESWLSAGPGAPLLDYMGPSRQATHLKHLIGAAPVVYGLPVHLQ